MKRFLKWVVAQVAATFFVMYVALCLGFTSAAAYRAFAAGWDLFNALMRGLQ